MSHNSLQMDHQASSIFVIEHRNNKTSLAIESERYPDSHTGYTAVLARFQFVSRTHTPHQTQKSTENYRSQRIIGGKATLTSICSAIAFGHKVQHLFNHLLSDLSSILEECRACREHTRCVQSRRSGQRNRHVAIDQERGMKLSCCVFGLREK
mmetsp:Transcript_48099/g.65498  ORF Transcript_48099/g.65498 Transcript_48099/m.65498 type:complete len:153 (-) Transcript_48099:860-1318(-)